MAALAPWLVGCGGPPPSAPPRVLDLDDTIPDGYSSLLRIRPRELLAQDATMRVAEAIVPSTRLDAFRDRHGVDARELEVLARATYDGAGSIVVARGTFHANVVVGEIGHRMAPLESSADRPLTRRAGIYLMRRFELIALGAHEIGLVDGPPDLAGLLVHTREEALSSDPAPRTRARSLIADEADAALLFVLHGRPELPPAGIGLLLARLEDSSLAASAAGPDDPGAIELRVRLFGEFPPGADENFRTLIASLSDSDLGRAVGLEEVSRTLAIEVLEGEIRLLARVRATTLARGLRVLLGAEIDEMLDDAT